MFIPIFFFELTYWLKNSSYWMYTFAFSGLAFLGFIGSAGFFDPITNGSAPPNDLFNSPLSIYQFLLDFNKLWLFLVPSIIGFSINKDITFRTDQILFSFPFSKDAYLLGRFCGSFVALILVVIITVGAIILADVIANWYSLRVGLTPWNAYLKAFFVFLLPNILMVGFIIFGLVLWTKNVFVGFVTAFCIILLQTGLEQVLAHTGQLYLLALLDPFGQHTIEWTVQNWNKAERNSLTLPINLAVMINRLVGATISMVVFIYFYRGFSFQKQNLSPITKSKNRESHLPVASSQLDGELPKHQGSFGLGDRLNGVLQLTKFHFLFLIKHKFFLVFLIFGVVTFLFMVNRVTNAEEMALLPTTGLIITVPSFFISMIATAIAFLFTGLLVNRDRSTRMDVLIDSTPIKNWVLFAAQFASVVLLQLMWLLLFALGGIIFQLTHGHDYLDLELYAYHLLVLKFPNLIIWTTLSFFVHIWMANFYLGLFFLLIAWIGILGLPEIGIESRVWLFNHSPIMLYSDIAGYDEPISGVLVTQLYWWIFGGILLLGALIMWPRGRAIRSLELLKMLPKRINISIQITTIGLLILFLTTAFFIRHIERKSLIHAPSPAQQKEQLDAFREKFDHYKKLPQPKITEIVLEIDLFPNRQEFKATGRYCLTNKSNQPIKHFFIKCGFDEESQIQIAKRGEVMDINSNLKVIWWTFDQVLLPEEQIELTFVVNNKQNTLFQRNSNVLRNGTFLKHDFLPRIGLAFAYDLPAPDTPGANKMNFYAYDADLIHVETHLSTRGDQIGIAPGKLIQAQSIKSRNHFFYQTIQPVKFNLSFHSGRYQKTSSIGSNRGLEIFYHSEHGGVIERLASGFRAAMQFNEKYFSPYTIPITRIVEYPITEGTFATLLSNNLLMSELSFINQPLASPSSIDWLFYITVHELTHYWWGNMVMPARAVGSTMLTESITEFITLKIYEAEFGTKQTEALLAIQRERYLKGKLQYSDTEPPLVGVQPEQEYLSYGKGTLVFHALSQIWGEERLWSFLSSFWKSHNQQKESYPTSLDFTNQLKQQLPDSLVYLVEDYFERVVHYSLELEDMALKKLPTNQFEVELIVELEKFQDHRPIDFAEYLEVGFYDENQQIISLEKVKVHQGSKKIKCLSERRPKTIVLDPHHILLDLDLSNNRISR